MIVKALIVMPVDEYSSSQYAITRPCMVAYAKKNNLQLVEITDNQHGINPLFNKYRLKELCKDYEQTLYLDCDVVITDIAPNIFDTVPQGYGMVDEWPILSLIPWGTGYQEHLQHTGTILGYSHTPEKIPNAGVMVLPTDIDYYLIEEAPAYWCLDQFLLAYRLPSETKWLSNKWNWTYFHPNWEDGAGQAYFVHTNGTRNNKRLWLLNNLVEELGMR